MKLLFQQRFFSWFDSYDIYDEQGEIAFTVKGKLSWGHKLEIYDKHERHIGTLKEEVFTFLPRCVLYVNGNRVGTIKKEFTFFKPKYEIDCNGWHVSGDFLGWEYQVTDSAGRMVMSASKEIFRLTDTYVIDVRNPEDTLMALMVVLAIDVVQCSRNS